MVICWNNFRIGVVTLSRGEALARKHGAGPRRTFFQRCIPEHSERGRLTSPDFLLAAQPLFHFLFQGPVCCHVIWSRVRDGKSLQLCYGGWKGIATPDTFKKDQTGAEMTQITAGFLS